MENFYEFLKGSLQRSSNHSFVKYLPEDILYKIWLDYAIKTSTLSELIEKGMMDCVKYGLSQGMTYSEDVVCHDVGLVAWLYEQGKKISLLSGVRSENIQVVEFILSKEEFEARDGAMLEYVAETNRNVCVYEFIYKKYYFGGYVTTNSLRGAIVGENYEVMKWILFNNKSEKFTEDHLYLLLERGNIDAVKWVKEQNLFFYENGEQVLLHCVKSGNIDVLKLLEGDEKLRPCSSVVYEYAISKNVVEIFVWLHQKYNFKCTYALLRMSTNSHTNWDLASYIFSERNLGYSFDEAVMWSCAYDDLFTIRFLLDVVDHSVETLRQVVQDATRWGGRGVLEYMYRNFRHVFDRDLVYRSLGNARKNFIRCKESIKFMEKNKTRILLKQNSDFYFVVLAKKEDRG